MIPAILAATIFHADLDAAISAAVNAAVKKASPSVVRIDVIGGASLTGVVIDGQGLIVTSAHAFANSTANIAVTFDGGRQSTAKLEGVDRVMRLAYLRVGIGKTTAIGPAPADRLRTGASCIAIGRTLSDSPTASLGIVSALGRVWGKAIQTDAKTSPTNYGGPLVDLDGRVLGVIVPLSPDREDADAGSEFYDSGIGFAIPVKDVLQSAERMKNGAIEPGLLGLSWKSAKPLDAPVKVERVFWKSPAAEGELRVGDQIVSADGKPIAFFSQFRTAVGRLYAGDAIKLKVKSGRQEREVSLKALAKLPVYRRPYLGLSLGEEKGRLVVRGADGPAATAGVKSNDILVELDGPVRSRKDAVGKLAEKAAGDAFAVVVERSGKREAVAVRSSPRPEAIPEVERTIAVGAATRTDQKGVAKLWLLKPKSESRALVVVLDQSSADRWRAICERYSIAVVGSDDRIEPVLLAISAAGVQAASKLEPDRTVLFGSGLMTLMAMEPPLSIANAAVVTESPFIPQPAQPDEPRSYLVVHRKDAGSLVEAVKKARDDGVSIAETTADDAKMPDVVAQWAVGLERL
jgi:S1-C subfamily serine protease